MSSHAVFNALTYVQHQIASSESRASLKALSAFANFIRKSSDDIDQAQRNINKEFDMLKSYCVLEQWRFSDRINIKTELEAEQNILVPGFIFSPFVEQIILSLLKSNQENIDINILVTENQLLVNLDVEIAMLNEDELNEEQGRRRVLLEERIEHLSDLWQIEIKPEANTWQLNFKTK